jgi:hypothetical protein
VFVKGGGSGLEKRISPLRCGMTRRAGATAKTKCKGNSEDKSKGNSEDKSRSSACGEG